ncbi:MAG TPA: universal stress protein [Steroidobacteraceae bacterium]
MPAIRRILVAVKELNGKPLPAVLKGAQLARAYGAPLELFHGLAAPLYTDTVMARQKGLVSLEHEMRQKALRRLEAIADRLRAHSIKVTVSAEWDYPAHEAIIRRAHAIKADLIVASLHAGRHRMPWLLRLTDWELVRLSPIPVLLVKNPHPYRRAAILAAIDPTHAHEKPLQLDKEILRVAKTLSAAMSGSLHAVHAYPRFPALFPESITAATLEAMHEDAERSAQARFSRAVRPARIARSRQYLIARQPIDAIAEASRQSRCAIVVMGAIARSGYKRLLIGNTAERILDDLTCDIMIVKPAKFRSDVPRALRGTRLRMNVPAGALGFSFG